MSQMQRWTIIFTLVAIILGVAMFWTTRPVNVNNANTADDTTEYWGRITTEIPTFNVTAANATAANATAAIVAINLASSVAGGLRCDVTFREPGGKAVTRTTSIDFGTIPVSGQTSRDVNLAVFPEAKKPTEAVPQLACTSYVNP
jgi:hypothetical protein